MLHEFSTLTSFMLLNEKILIFLQTECAGSVSRRDGSVGLTHYCRWRCSSSTATRKASRVSHTGRRRERKEVKREGEVAGGKKEKR